MQALADSLKTDRRQVLACIKYEVLGKRSVCDAYKTFCKRTGDDVMGYPEFEFWFMRFNNGEVVIDGSEDPKRLELMQLPVEIVGKVVGKLDLPSRLITRNVCKPLRTMVDRCKLKFKSLKIFGSIGKESSHLVLDDVRIDYDLNEDKQGTRMTCGERQYQTKRKNVSDFAVSDLKTLIGGHDMQLDLFEIFDSTDDARLFKKALNVFVDTSVSSNSLFKVKKALIGCTNPHLIVSCLELFEPKVLEDVFVNQVSDEILNTVQWQQAKIGRVKAWNGVNPTEIKRFSHFEEFYVKINDISAEIMVQLITILTSPAFKRCEILKPSNPRFTIHHASTALWLPIQNQQIHVPIPDSLEFLIIAIPLHRSGIISIERRHV